jgi:adenylate cyclase
MSSGETIVRLEESGGVTDHPLERMAVCRIGRGYENNIVLDDNLASREHTMIRRNATGHCILSDLGSRNGTRLNGRPVTAATPLNDGDVISIGKHRLFFVQDASALESPEPLSGGSDQATQFLLSETLVTVLVTDVRGFTVISQILGEKRISEMMAEIFRSAGEILDRQKAWSQKFIGDAIMAVWTHTNDRVTPAELLRVFDVIGELQEMFRPLQRQFDLLRPLDFGCGINSGFASIGNVGSASAADFTAMGDTVNKAFRLESATKETGCNILIGKQVFEFLTPPLSPENWPQSQALDLKGYDQPEHGFPLRFEDLSDLAGKVARSS